jgi:truncated hemoglobin YjbI
MSKPIPDKAEVALEYPDKYYLGTFERSARFEAHLDATGASLTLERTGDPETRKSVHLHLNDGLFAEVLRDLAASVKAAPPGDAEHREALAQAARLLHQSLASTHGRATRRH